MEKHTGFSKKLIALLIASIIFLLPLNTVIFSDVEKTTVSESFNLSRYENYSRNFDNIEIIDNDVLLNAETLNDYSNDVLIHKNYEGKNDSVIEMPEGSWIEWTFEAGEEFVSNILFEYNGG